MEEIQIGKPVEGGFKLITDKQKQLIEQLLQSSRIEKRYKQYVVRALKNTVSSYSASKIITFLVAYIAFKKDFVIPYRSNGKRGKRAKVQKVPIEVVRGLVEDTRSDINTAIRAMENEALDAAYRYLVDLHRRLSTCELIEVREM